MHKLNIDVNRLIEMYMSGKTCREIAEIVGASKPYVNKALRNSGVKMRSRRAEIPPSQVIELYLSGVSENKVAESFGVSRTPIRRILISAGIDPRGRSEAELLKWSQMSPEQKAAQVKAANDAIRCMPSEFHKTSSELQAKAKEKSLSKVGHLEAEFSEAFISRGHNVIPQKAAGPYNIDIAIGNTAIEIHANSCNPHSHSYYRQRVVNLMKGGWHVIYIKTLGNISIERAADEVSRMINLIESDKPSVCQYGMVRGSGQLVASGCLDGDQIAIVNASNGFFA